jgi:hypothetical protein
VVLLVLVLLVLHPTALVMMMMAQSCNRCCRQKSGLLTIPNHGRPTNGRVVPTKQQQQQGEERRCGWRDPSASQQMLHGEHRHCVGAGWQRC